jgi:hypothetical protein
VVPTLEHAQPSGSRAAGSPPPPSISTVSIVAIGVSRSWSSAIYFASSKPRSARTASPSPERRYFRPSPWPDRGSAPLAAKSPSRVTLLFLDARRPALCTVATSWRPAKSPGAAWSHAVSAGTPGTAPITEPTKL